MNEVIKIGRGLTSSGFIDHFQVCGENLLGQNLITRPISMDGLAIRSVEEKVYRTVPEIEKVIFSNNCTIVFWKDGSEKTIVKCSNEDFDKEKGLAMAICKKIMSRSKFCHLLKEAKCQETKKEENNEQNK